VDLILSPNAHWFPSEFFDQPGLLDLAVKNARKITKKVFTPKVKSSKKVAKVKVKKRGKGN
jgi:hypothetical protein